MELASFPQWAQTSVPDVKAKNLRDMEVMIPVVVDTATNSFFSIQMACIYVVKIELPYG